MSRQVVLALLMVVLAVVAVRWRLGPRSDVAVRVIDRLRSPGVPRVIGNLPMAMFPVSVMGLALAGVATEVPGVFEASIATVLVAALVSTWFLIQPPGWAKPPWMRELEAQGRWVLERFDALQEFLLIQGVFAIHTLIAAAVALFLAA